MTGPDGYVAELVEHVIEETPERQASEQDGLTGEVQERNARFAELQAMESAYAALALLDHEARNRAFKWLADALDFTGNAESVPIVPRVEAAAASGAAVLPPGQDSPDPKEFIGQKKPQSAVERVACLAYYLAHYRDVQHFRAPDIVALNTEAASHKFANPSRDVDNADRKNGYIVSAGNGAKQITVRGEALVVALPDREAVKLVLQEHAYRPKRPSTAGKKTTASTKD
ncbi:hypothetical protein NLX83_29705 [Allokutzneria sp. A3M-2-11 16]|uniref:hypothetical protein n=1 Tax=Allokutzneria sp. A3M-2-11 16 TaxID=2962043 RepID=UPI0020B652DA|nr:hypothetical protein [Allokutzneria sp. A3M-2-11 16]MCP3803459.1 hypothetical protein [Allokutzneria sp. A3M-2-11 16]